MTADSERVLVTGGTGFLAGWAIVALLHRGYQVRTTVRSAAREHTVRDAVATQLNPDGRLEFAVADLTSRDGWTEAVTGCDYVLHVASPLSADNPSDPDELIVPARDGVLNVLTAAGAEGVQRVVMTSAANTASPSSYTEDGIYDETTWTADDPALPAYRRSKTIAEKAAWDFIADYDGPMTLTTVLPGAVLGPILRPDNVGSAQIVQRLLQGVVPGVPRIGLEIVDVRDEIELHILAMTSPHAAGQRFLGTGEFMWMRDVAAALKEHLGEAGARISTQELPDEAVRQASQHDVSLQQILPALGRRSVHTTEKARRILGWQPRPGAAVVVDTAHSLIEHDLT